MNLDTYEYKEVRKPFDEDENDIFNLLIEKYSQFAHDFEFTIQSEVLKRAIHLLYKLNLVVAKFIIQNEVPDLENKKNFIFNDASAKGLFNNHKDVDNLIKIHKEIIRKSDIQDKKFYPESEKYNYKDVSDWRFYLIENIYVPNDEETILLFKYFIELEEKVLNESRNTLRRISNYILSPTMSSGESSYMNFFSRLYDVIERYDSGYDDRNNLIVFIDEGEIGYHPAWNKCFLKWVINFLNNYTKKYKFQIILTTHSPYLLSDLTSSNIILLKRGHNGNTEIVPSDKFSTFGANIHELLANSFFLTDGFIGEFAKQNIQWVIDKLNEWRLLKSSNNLIAGQVTGHDKNRVLEIITIIADLIVRNKLFEMYWEIFDEDSALTNEIELLQERIDQLKNRKRDDIN